MVLELQIIVVRSKNLRVLERRLLCSLIVPLHEKLRKPTCQTRRKRDKPLVVLFQQLHIHARAVIKAVQKAARDHIAEVPVARLVFAEQHQVVCLAVKRVHLVKARSGRDIDLAADDGLHARRLRRLVKVNCAVHDAVVGDGDRVLPQLLDPVH